MRTSGARRSIQSLTCLASARTRCRCSLGLIHHPSTPDRSPRHEITVLHPLPAPAWPLQLLPSSSRRQPFPLFRPSSHHHASHPGPFHAPRVAPPVRHFLLHLRAGLHRLRCTCVSPSAGGRRHGNACVHRRRMLVLIAPSRALTSTGALSRVQR